MRPDIFHDEAWQMAWGERAALEGVLSALQPGLAIEIATAANGSLERTAAHSGVVHSFDVVSPDGIRTGENVVPHTGDWHELLPRELGRLADAGRNVDFVLIDGDRAGSGVRQDVEGLLNSLAVAKTVILIHSTATDTVRTGLDAVHFGAWPKVAYVDLDFVPGRLCREQHRRHEPRGGLGVLMIDSARLAYGAASPIEDRWYPAAQVLTKAREQIIEEEQQSTHVPAASATANSSPSPDVKSRDRLLGQIGELEEEILRLSSVSAHHEALWKGMMDSASWRITAPLRAVASARRRIVR
jgi:hypothetical protein